MTAIDLILGVFFFTWFVLTVIIQFEGHCSIIKITRFDYFNLLPRWTFFAPNPCVCDYNLAIREYDLNGIASPWESVDIVLDRKISSAFWNPCKRSSKCLYDSVHVLLSFDSNDYPPVLTFPYLWLLNISMKHPRLPNAVCRQFAI